MLVSIQSRISNLLSHPYLWQDGFRAFFILLPAYLILYLVFWIAIWSGYLSLKPAQDLLTWHMYELTFGAGTAAMAGFILTALPEFFEQVKAVRPAFLKAMVLLWLLGRLSFWFMPSLGILPAALINLGLVLVLVIIMAKPVRHDRTARHIGLFAGVVLIFLLQTYFFVAAAGFGEYPAYAVLKLALGGFMVLELLVLRRINTGVTNMTLEQVSREEVFIAKPPAYNYAIVMVILFSICEFLSVQDSILGWLALACAAAILNTSNDYFQTEYPVFKLPMVLPLAVLLVLMALGYGFIGVDYLLADFYALNHFRHFLTTGVFGLSFFLVMVIVSTVHTGRKLAHDKLVYFALVLLLSGTLVRVSVAFFPLQSMYLYVVSAFLWSLPFLIFMFKFLPKLLSSSVSPEETLKQGSIPIQGGKTD